MSRLRYATLFVALLLIAGACAGTTTDPVPPGNITATTDTPAVTSTFPVTSTTPVGSTTSPTTVAPIVDAWKDIEAPPRFESLRRRSDEVLSTVLTLVAELFEIAQTREGFTDEEAATAMAVELTTLSLKTQLLEAEGARPVAAVSRELSE